MAQAYLYFNALLYLGLAAWCTIAPTTTSRAIGFEFTKNSARSEYITVYGGLELGLALFFAMAAWSPSLRSAGLLFALLTYGCLAVFRIGTLLTLDNLGRFPFLMVALEVPLAILAGWLYFRSN